MKGRPPRGASFDRWFVEMIEAMDVTGFTMLCIAALGAGRVVDGRHLARGTGLISAPMLVGSFAWHMSGDVVPHLLAATGDGAVVLPVFQCAALLCGR